MGYKTHAPTDEELGYGADYYEWEAEQEDYDPDFDEFGVRYPGDEDAPAA